MGISKYKNGMIFPTKSCGDIKIFDYQDRFNIGVKFMDTENTAYITAAALRSGYARDVTQPSLYGVGFIGKGTFNTRNPDGKSKNRAYMYWSRMLKRCYDTKSKDYPMYGEKGVTVCKEWHNFQNFSEWFYSQKNCKVTGVHLDKDLTYIGNKIYCSSLCYLVPPRVNTLSIDRKTSGVSWHQVANKWVTYLEGGRAVRSKDATYLMALYESYKRDHVYSVLREEYAAGNISSKILVSVYNHVNSEYNTITHENVDKSSTDSVNILFTLKGGLLGGKI